MVSYEYIAGFFDGEGYIQIAKRSPGTGHSGSPYWLCASMANTHRGVLDEIQKVAGGRVIFHKGAGKFPHYRLTFYTKEALNFIKAIQPYLITKREEADLAVAFYECIRKPGRGPKLSELEMTTRIDFYDKMKAMKGNRGANTWTLNLG